MKPVNAEIKSIKIRGSNGVNLSIQTYDVYKMACFDVIRTTYANTLYGKQRENIIY